MEKYSEKSNFCNCCTRIRQKQAEWQYKELSDYLNEKVSLESVLINSKEQNTQTNASPDATNIWKNRNFMK